jgi:hypothetical protein
MGPNFWADFFPPVRRDCSGYEVGDEARKATVVKFLVVAAHLGGELVINILIPCGWKQSLQLSPEV